MYCDFYFNSKDAKVRIQICSKILMRIFNFNWCQPFDEGFEIIIFIFIDFLTLFRSLKWKLHNPLGAEVCSFTLYTSSSSRQNICSCEKSTFFFFLTYKRGGGKNFWWTTERLLKWQTSCDDTIVSTKYRKIGVSLTRLLLVRATNSKLLGTKILEVSKTFRV